VLHHAKGLIGSAAGGKFIGQSPGVIFDLALHLVKGTPRVQRQVLSVLTKLIPLVGGGSGASLGNGNGLGIVPTLLLTLASCLNLQVSTAATFLISNRVFAHTGAQLNL
jgi:hypothetical protein